MTSQASRKGDEAWKLQQRTIIEYQHIHTRMYVCIWEREGQLQWNWLAIIYAVNNYNRKDKQNKKTKTVSLQINCVKILAKEVVKSAN